MDEAIAISKKGKGSLCTSITTADDRAAREYVVGAATHHGRILVLNEACAKEKYRSRFSYAYANTWRSWTSRRR